MSKYHEEYSLRHKVEFRPAENPREFADPAIRIICAPNRYGIGDEQTWHRSQNPMPNHAHLPHRQQERKAQRYAGRVRVRVHAEDCGPNHQGQFQQLGGKHHGRKQRELHEQLRVSEAGHLHLDGQGPSHPRRHPRCRGRHAARGAGHARFQAHLRPPGVAPLQRCEDQGVPHLRPVRCALHGRLAGGQQRPQQSDCRAR